ncbi:MAG: T9SS type A sorting domain-containing protein, partial [Bacteroidetes bacterium]|nr:T9SS type A sorting domain-containing protein [Bacteroidota bacterium]MBU2507451.1 T9SS type A sorting domain-containing protein [Bacteroidota bacterium]
LQKLTNIGELSHYTSPSLSWSPDGKKIVFSTKEQIYIVDVETKEITQITNDNYWNYTPEWVVFYPTSVDEPKVNIVEEFELYQNYPNPLVFYALSANYPNPFNPSTSIHYQLPGSGHVSLKVYDMLGREIAELVNEKKESGIYTINFDASSFGGSSLSSGTYIYTLKVNEFSQSRKMLLLK